MSTWPRLAIVDYMDIVFIVLSCVAVGRELIVVVWLAGVVAACDVDLESQASSVGERYRRDRMVEVFVCNRLSYHFLQRKVVVVVDTEVRHVR